MPERTVDVEAIATYIMGKLQADAWLAANVKDWQDARDWEQAEYEKPTLGFAESQCPGISVTDRGPFGGANRADRISKDQENNIIPMMAFVVCKATTIGTAQAQAKSIAPQLVAALAALGKSGNDWDTDGVVNVDSIATTYILKDASSTLKVCLAQVLFDFEKLTEA